MGNSAVNWLSPQMRMYVFKAISKTREIRCEDCGSYEGIELHHTKYAPAENVSIQDITLLCNKCHRNTDYQLSDVKTTFKDGKRYCESKNFTFEYVLLLFILSFTCLFSSHSESLKVYETIAYEAAGEPFEGQILVARTIRTRMKQRGMSAGGVCLQPWQFSCWNKGAHRRILTWDELKTAKQAWDASADIPLEITHYHADYVDPYWADSMRFIKKIGKHLFYYGR